MDTDEDEELGRLADSEESADGAHEMLLEEDNDDDDEEEADDTDPRLLLADFFVRR